MHHNAGNSLYIKHMIRPSDIHSLTDFTRNAKAYVEEIKRNRRPMAITVNGEAELIVMDVETYEARFFDHTVVSKPDAQTPDQLHKKDL